MGKSKWVFFCNEHNSDLAKENIRGYRKDYPDYEFKMGGAKGQYAQPGFESKVGIYRRKKEGRQ
jgi:hypothetical protein